MNRIIIAEVETAIWDLDGTLVDSADVVTDILGQIAPKHGLVLPDEETMRHHFHGPLVDSFKGLFGVTGKALSDLEADFLEAQKDYYHVAEDHLFPDAVRLAQRLHAAGAKQAIVTNRNHEGRGTASPRNLVENSSLKPLISLVISGDDGEHRKPLRAAISSLETITPLEPASTLVIGDQFVDAQFAMNLGAQAVIVCREGEPVHMEKLGDGWRDHVTVVTSLDEVL